MYTLGNRLQSLRKKGGLTQEELVRQLNEKFELNINKGMLSKWESDKVEPRMNIVRAFALHFDISLNSLLGIDESERNMNDSLTGEQSVQEELQKMIEGLNSGNCTIFENQSTYEVDEEDKELLIASLENSLRLAKRITKQTMKDH